MSYVLKDIFLINDHHGRPLTLFVLLISPLQAFEHLCALELVSFIDGTSGRTQKEYREMTLLVDSSQVTDALQKYPNCPTEVKQWATSVVLV